MSREILAFSLLPGVVLADLSLGWFFPGSILVRGAAFATSLIGLGAVFTSAMIYVDTHRAFWRASLTMPRFYGAVFALGAASIPVALVLGGLPSETVNQSMLRAAAGIALCVQLGMFAWEKTVHRRALLDPQAAIHESALIAERLLKRVSLARTGCLAASVACWVAVIAVPDEALVPSAIGLLSACAAQILERYIFFTAVVALRMPGGL